MAHYMPLRCEDSMVNEETELFSSSSNEDEFEKDAINDQFSHLQEPLVWDRFPTLRDTLNRLIRSGQTSVTSLKRFWKEKDWAAPKSSRDALWAVYLAARPSFLAPLQTRKISSTSWLDGLRGLAAFVVVIYHSHQVFYGGGTCAAWYRDDPYFFRLPLVRLHCSGTAMVDVFFVVSGYALSYKPLSIIRTEDFLRLSSSLASAVLRRGIRLYLPVASITFTNAMASYLQLFDSEGRDHVPYEESFLLTLTSWLNDFLVGINPFTVDRYRSWDMAGLRYEASMWTIPYEYRGSMAVYAMLLVMGRVRRLPGFALLLAMVLYVLAMGQWDTFLFLSGVLCCQVHHHIESRPNPLSPTGSSVEKPGGAQNDNRPLFRKAATICGLLAILFVLTMPDHQFGLGDVAFYPAIMGLSPNSWSGLPDPGRFPVCIAAVVLVLYAGYNRLLKGWLSSRFPHYLGQISFAIYLVHFFLINTLGRPLMRLLYAGKDAFGLTEGLAGVVGEWLALLVYIVLAVPVLFWCGEMVNRYVDEKSVEAARWAEDKCVNKN